MIGVGTTIFLVNFSSGASYLLDDYSAAAAYSLRQLKTGVTNVVRVRRSSDNAESDFTADEITDGTLTTWTGANDGFVAKLYNQGTDGSTYDFSQSIAGSQPRIVNAGTLETKNGLPAMYFDGSDDHLLSDNYMTVNYIVPNARSWYCVASNDRNLDSWEQVVSIRESGGDLQGVFLSIGRSTTKACGFYKGSTGYVFNYLTQQNHSDQRLMVLENDSSFNGEVFYNGVSQETISSMGDITGMLNTYGMIGGMGAGNRRLQGHIQEVILYNTDESANRSDIETNINDFYSIY